MAMLQPPCLMTEHTGVGAFLSLWNLETSSDLSLFLGLKGQFSV